MYSCQLLLAVVTVKCKVFHKLKYLRLLNYAGKIQFPGVCLSELVAVTCRV